MPRRTSTATPDAGPDDPPAAAVHINDIDKEAAKYKEAFSAAIEEQGQLVIDNVQDYLADYRGDLERNLETVKGRISEPEIASRIELIGLLEPLDLAASKLVTSLRKPADR
jgi:hypothetical protein